MKLKLLYLWSKNHTVLSDIDIYFDEIVHKTENDFVVPQDALFYVQSEHIDCVAIQTPYLNEKKRSIYKLLKENNVKLLILDRGALPNSWFFDPNVFNADSSSYAANNWDHPLSNEPTRAR